MCPPRRERERVRFPFQTWNRPRVGDVCNGVSLFQGEDTLTIITNESDTSKKPRKRASGKPPISPSVTRSQNSEYNSGASRSVSRASTTPEYLKEAFGMRKPKHSRLAKNGYVPGTPNYKEREDMYDEIIKLKKVIQAHKTENDVTKTKLRRSEEENSKKEKHIEQLLDPSKSSEYTRNLVDKNNVNGIVRGLKQKILKLEQQCREKENSLNKLQTDLKTSDIEEMRITMETYYEEIQRLRLLLSAEKKDPAESRESQKLLNSTRLRLSKTIKLLQEENKTLKMDLDRVLSNSPATSTARGTL
uniref:IQ domain-containing protein E n=1 Tax=Callorhinchus milii TaxID=7868 RepID=A0A4W3IE74_CALMI